MHTLKTTVETILTREADLHLGRSDNSLRKFELPSALEGTITKTVAHRLAVSLGHVPPVVVIVPAKPAGSLLARTNVKPITRSQAAKLAISRRVFAVANLIVHK
jgi:hypothetical protein